jgi:O-antigen/teichoic acid export membrane protein
MDDRPDETPHERLDRNFAELLQEVRVLQTGVQILFAFLLTLPFSARFATIEPLDRIMYVVTLMASALASVLLIAPVSYHRLVFRQDRKAELVRTASLLAEIGTVALLVGIAGAVFVVIDVVVGLPFAIVVAVLVAVFGGLLWYVMPLRHRSGRVRPSEPRPGPSE